MKLVSNVFFNILKKELHLLFSGSGFFWLSLIFSIGLFMLFRFTLPPEHMSGETAVSILWAAHLISCLFCLLAAQEWEWEWFAYRAVRLSGTQGHLVFVSKSTASFIALVLLWLLELIIWFIFFNSTFMFAGDTFIDKGINIINMFILAGSLTTIGITFLGQLAAILALHSRFRHILLLILFFPLSLPVLIAGSSFCRNIINGGMWQDSKGILNLIIAFLFIYLAAGIALYDYLWEE
ncbi:MAG: heme exporter protein CcmB [Spirochaetia bacterium]|nr:heme exporter protein CcmB [Spirochaetia bacterium]